LLDTLELYYFGVALVSAYILAGGKSSRMGSDKALLELNGRTLLRRAVELTKTVTDRVTIVGDPAKFSAFGPVISDIHAGRGPLGGIHSALMNSQTELNLIVAVDLPFLESALLRYIVSKAEATDALVTLPLVQTRYQPLSAAYRKEFAAIAESALRKGKNKIDALFPAISVRVISEDELQQDGFSSGAFRNINSPEDLRQATRQLKGAAFMMNRDHEH
jgi:molybdopterin-guanine dinucleotide biosynthesis protein A